MTRTSVIRSSRSLRLAAALALALPLTACVDETDGPADFADFASGDIDPAGAEAEAAAGVVVAELETVDGARLIFVDEGGPDGEPAIGVEILSSTTTPSTDRLLGEQPSPLELYLAVAPDKVAPRALVRDHELLAAASDEYGPEPRRLDAASAVGESVVPYDCENATQWAADFDAWAPDLAGEHIQTHWGDFSGYVGNAYKFYFDVCRPLETSGAETTVTTKVRRRTSASAPWSAPINSQTEALDYQQRRWRYYRNTLTCSSYQYLLDLDTNISTKYRLAARWSNQWSCTIQF